MRAEETETLNQETAYYDASEEVVRVTYAKDCQTGQPGCVGKMSVWSPRKAVRVTLGGRGV